MTNPPRSKQQAIFELMDNYNTKQALKLIAQTEPKYPQSQVLKSMKIVNLHRIGDVATAKTLALELLNSGEPFNDENVVQMMWIMMRKMNLAQEAVVALRRTNELTRGTNEYVFQTYFAALLNAGEFGEMQKAAMAAYRTSKRSMHQVWATMCNLLQVKPQENGNMLLKLANLVLTKYFADKENQFTWEVAWLHIHVLKWMLNYDAALKFLQTEAAADAVSMETERLGFVFEVFEAQKNTRGVAATAKTLLSGVDDERDNWRWWIAYFDALTELINNPPTSGDAPIIPARFQPADVKEDDAITTYPAEAHDSSYAAARVFIDACLVKEAKVESARPRRATRLASCHLTWLELIAEVGYTQEALPLGTDPDNATLAAPTHAVGSEAWERCMKHSTSAAPPASITESAAALVETLLDGVVGYLQWLKYKPQGYLDTVKFLPLINWLGKGDELLARVGTPEDPLADAASLNHQHTYLKVEYALGKYDNVPSDDVAVLTKEWLEFSDGATKFNSSVEYDKPAADDAIQFAALVNLLQYHRTGERRYAAQTLVCMAKCARPKANTQMQQWQMLVNSFLGVPHAVQVAEQLDLKFIQMESLTYLTFAPVAALCGDKEAQDLNRKVRRFHDRLDADHSEITMNAWHLLTCSKVFESYQLRQSLKNSLVRREVFLHAVWSSYLESCGTGASDRKTLDELDNLPPLPADDALLEDNKDTTCVASTLMSDPHSCRSHYLKSTLLGTVDAARDLHAHRVPHFKSCYHSLRAVRELLALQAQVAEEKKADSGTGKKDKKKNKTSQEGHADPNAVDRWQTCAEEAKKAVEALEKVTAEAVRHLVDAEAFAVCHAVSTALLKLLHAATASKDSSCEAEAAALATALGALPALLDTLSQPYKEKVYADTRSLQYALRMAVPFNAVVLQVLHAVGRMAAAPALQAACEGLKDALARIAANIAPAVDALGKHRDGAHGELLSAICGAESSLEWAGGDAAVKAVSTRTKDAWAKNLKRLSQTASNRSFDLQGAIRVVF
eukprot:TRINITY_DN25248_c0_g1_i1.p1 TRINITY_DN25248_c0_g1~~TRINITY_DN25248_c0_g1_i1.p1  ORF type:complete len:1020 (+),score=386.53 TRINITY_DN25248_c0_g1_i1:64-3123(+)